MVNLSFCSRIAGFDVVFCINSLISFFFAVFKSSLYIYFVIHLLHVMSLLDSNAFYNLQFYLPSSAPFLGIVTPPISFSLSTA